MKTSLLPRHSLRGRFALAATLVTLAAPLAAPGAAAESTEPILGRWDLTLHTSGGPRPSWLEVTASGDTTLVGRFVGVVGSARPISLVKWNRTTRAVGFSIPTQWDGGSGDESLDARLVGTDSIVGTFTDASGRRIAISGHRAPVMLPTKKPAWGKPIRMLNGKDLTGWHVIQGTSHWTVEKNGVLHNTAGGGGNLVSDRKFTDFKIHVEFFLPKDENSGVYLRGRYEAQLQDDSIPLPQTDLMGGIYGFLEPTVIAAKRGKWQTYDITLVGRRVTVVLNGVQTICDRAIPGPTGGAIDSDEGAPGPIMLQGDHGPVMYRNIVITPAR